MLGSIYRISNVGLRFLDESYEKKLYGFNELFIPTILKKNNLIISDFNDHFDSYIDNETYNWNETKYNPNIKNKLWHKIITNE